tara:strand:+ start:183 stop:449 length:267 start_codon:yes stop_codon:yes gene_type:complete
MSIVETIVNDFNERQVVDSYYFKDSGVDIIWIGDREVYLALHDDKTFDCYSPSEIHFAIEGLTEKDLKSYILDMHGYDWDQEQEEEGQ